MRPAALATPLAWLAGFLALADVAARVASPGEDAALGGSLKLFPFAGAALALSIASQAVGGKCGGLGRSGWGMAGLLTLSAASAASCQRPWPAWVVATEWLAAACVWATLRRHADRLAGPALALVAALAVGQAALVLWQAAVELPKLRDDYRKRDPAVMAELGFMGIDPDSPLGFTFLARMETQLPFGTFGHTNNAAGLLAAGLPLLVAAALARRGTVAAAAFGALAGLAAFGLLRTQCRSAQFAVAAVGAAVAWQARARLAARLPLARILLVAALACGLGFAALAWKGAKRFDEAGKSLGYRLEWWEGAGKVFAASPALGVGWGNFRPEYTAYKREASSEEVADPHNFLLELLVSAGALAPLAYGVWIAGDRRPRAEPETKSPDAGYLPLAAACLGFVLAGAHEGSPPSPWFAGPVIACLLFRWSPPRSAAIWGLAALHLHWLAAGGVGVPGLLHATLALAATAWPAPLGSGRLAPAVLLAVAALVAQRTVVHPAAARDPWLAIVRNQQQRLAKPGLGKDEAQRRLALASAAADEAARLVPSDPSGWRLVVGLKGQRLRAASSEKPRLLAEAVEAAGAAIAAEPRHYGAWRERAMLSASAAAAGVEGASFDAAVSDLRAAVGRYPNSASLRFETAYVAAGAATGTGSPSWWERFARLAKTGPAASDAAESGADLGKRLAASGAAGAEAVATLREALRLDGVTPHLDKKLTMGQRAWAEAAVQAASDGGRPGSEAR